MADKNEIRRLLTDPRAPVRSTPVPQQRIVAQAPKPRRRVVPWLALAAFVIVVCATLAALIMRST